MGEYDEADAKEWSIEISEDVKARVKELAYKRYKIIVQVTIGELRDQGVRVASRCLWRRRRTTTPLPLSRTNHCGALRWFSACTRTNRCSGVAFHIPLALPATSWKASHVDC